MTRARLDDTIVTLTVSEAGTRVPDDGLMAPRPDRVLIDLVGVRSPPSTSWRWWPNRPAAGGRERRPVAPEGLYSSHIIEWRRARDTGALTGTASPPQAAARRGKSAEQTEIERLRRQNERLAVDLARNKAALEIMGKHTRSCSCSPRTPSTTRSRADDRGRVHGSTAVAGHETRLRPTRQVPRHALPALPTMGNAARGHRPGLCRVGQCPGGADPA
jgi:hypothetical protein